MPWFEDADVYKRQTQVSEINPVDEQPVHEFIALIEVDRADHGLESVAVDMFMMQRRRVSEEVFRYVKLYQQGRK